MFGSPLGNSWPVGLVEGGEQGFHFLKKLLWFFCCQGSQGLSKGT